MTPRLKCRPGGFAPSATACAQRLLGDVEPVHLQREVAEVDLHEREPRGRRPPRAGRARRPSRARRARRGSRPRLRRALRFSGSSSSTRSKPAAASSTRPCGLVGEGEVEHGDGGLGVELDRAPRRRDRGRRVLLPEVDRREGEVDARGCRGPCAPAPRAAGRPRRAVPRPAAPGPAAAPAAAGAGPSGPAAGPAPRGGRRSRRPRPRSRGPAGARAPPGRSSPASARRRPSSRFIASSCAASVAATRGCCS